MAEFVTIRHESQPEDFEGARTSLEAFETYYKAKGWVINGDAPAESPSNATPSLTVAEQVRLLASNPEKLQANLAPTSPEALAAEETADAQTDALTEVVANATAAELVAVVESNPEVAEQVAAAETAGKNRSTVTKAAQKAATAAETEVQA